MININSMLSTIDNETKKMKPGDQLIMSTFKKDRRIILINQSIDKWTIISNGYSNNQIENLTYKEAIKTIKKYRDIEFPRSNKIYLSIRKSK